MDRLVPEPQEGESGVGSEAEPNSEEEPAPLQTRGATAYRIVDVGTIRPACLHFGFSVLCGVLGLVDAHVPFPHPFFHPAVTRKSADTHSYLS